MSIRAILAIRRLAALVALLGAGLPARAQTVVLDPTMTGLLGHMVQSQSDKELGRIVDILVDPAGQPEAAVIDFGGFLGVGSRRVAVAWSALKFAAAKDELSVSLDIPSDRIRTAPDYQAGKPVQALTPVPAQ